MEGVGMGVVEGVGMEVGKGGVVVEEMGAGKVDSHSH